MAKSTFYTMLPASGDDLVMPGVSVAAEVCPLQLRGPRDFLPSISETSKPAMAVTEETVTKLYKLKSN
jgi:hypothetical protein